MTNDSLEFLVAETFKNVDCQSISDQDYHHYQNPDEMNGNDLGGYFPRQAPSGPGLIYNLQRNGYTFVIRAMACESIAKTFDSLVANPYEYPSLKLHDETRIDQQLKFFSCHSIIEAEVIKKALTNQRLPLREEEICNVSDPGFSWWLQEEDCQLTIYFKLSNTPRIGDLVKLGPLGQPRHFIDVFSNALPFLEKFVKIEEFSHGGHFLRLRSSQASTYFSSLLAFFRQGFILDSWRNSIGELAHYGVIRSFWLQVIDELEVLEAQSELFASN